ncbi:MAG: hypothetical protein RL189_1595 [Pseudomonadota bacterium]|jgi:hypothetical protein
MDFLKQKWSILVPSLFQSRHLHLRTGVSQSLFPSTEVMSEPDSRELGDLVSLTRR